MTRAAEIRLLWGDRERTLRLTIPDWEKVQEKCDAGPAEILNRLSTPFAASQAGLSLEQIVANGYVGSWRLHDVREPLYRGLIRGEGLSPTEAGKVIAELVDERPLLESACVAYQLVHASVVGAIDEPLGEPKGEAKTASPSPAESSASPASTPPPPS